MTFTFTVSVAAAYQRVTVVTPAAESAGGVPVPSLPAAAKSIIMAALHNWSPAGPAGPGRSESAGWVRAGRTDRPGPGSTQAHKSRVRVNVTTSESPGVFPITAVIGIRVRIWVTTASGVRRRPLLGA